MMEDHVITVVRNNPEAINCIIRLISQICIHIIKSTEKKTEHSTKKRFWDFQKDC